jgi:uncharacterized repeat protein (TIGR03803 family)
VASFGGLFPNGPMLEGSDGAFYGTGPDFGAVFKVKKDGTDAKVLHTFAGPPGDGNLPVGPLIKGKDGLLYGMTSFGGSNNFGTIFSLSESGSNYGVVFHFGGGTNTGQYPVGALLQGSDGALYGVVANGGGTNLGMIFKVSTDGSGYSELKVFTRMADEGWNPVGGLVEGADGGLYGINSTTGFDGTGTAFKLGKDGTGFLVLGRFAGVPPGGNGFIMPFTLTADHDLYSVSFSGGDFNFGSIFRIGEAISLSEQPNRAVLGLTGIPGYAYWLQRSEDLANWINLFTYVLPVNSYTNYIDSGSPFPAAFYRLRAQ